MSTVKPVQGLRVVVPSSLVIALLVAAASLAGILSSATYARESAEWKAQGIGQDWFDLVVAVPVLVICALAARGGSPRWRLMLGGALMFIGYTFVLYAFAVQFNRLFLVYCAVLGLSFYSLVGVAGSLAGANLRLGPRAPARAAGGFLIAIAVVFAGLWLSEIIPAIISGHVPKSVAQTGLFTNPVHVLDLAIVLPAHLLAGVLLFRRHPLAAVLAPVILAFGVLMASSIAGLMLVMHLRGLEVVPAVAAVIAVVALLSAIALAAVLARVSVERNVARVDQLVGAASNGVRPGPMPSRLRG